MKEKNWIKLKKPLEISKDILGILFGEMEELNPLKGGYWSYKFEEIELVALDLDNSKIKIIKIRNL